MFYVGLATKAISQQGSQPWGGGREEKGQSSQYVDNIYIQYFFCKGEATVPVADCRKKEFSGHAKKQMKMKDFLDYWRKNDQAGSPCSGESLYLKDWHFTR